MAHRSPILAATLREVPRPDMAATARVEAMSRKDLAAIAPERRAQLRKEWEA